MSNVKSFKQKKKIGKAIEKGALSQVSEFLARKDAKDVQTYVTSVVEKFKNYIKAMAVWGSITTGIGKKKTSDVDIAVIVDDTDVRTMTRQEVKEKLFQRLIEIAYPISKKIHPQPYLLTEFWEYVREGNPVIMNILRSGVVIYDTGFILPVQMLYKMGSIKPSKEAIDKHILASKQLIELAKSTFLEKMTYDLEQAVVSASQAILMEFGYRAPAPKEVPKFIEDVLLEKKIIEKKHVDWVKEIIQTYKDVEHKSRKKYLGTEFDKHLKWTEEYVELIEKELKELRKKKGETYKYEIAEKLDKLEVKRDGMLKIDRTASSQEKADKIIEESLGQR